MPVQAHDSDVAEIEILGFRLRVIAPLRFLDPLRQRLAAPTGCIDAGLPGYSATIEALSDAAGLDRYRVERDGVPLATLPGSALVRYLEWLVHATAVARLGRRFLLLHAGAVACGSTGVVLCASSGSGKSTLTAGLVAAGFRYLSDEIAALDPDTLLLQPYPRGICVKAGSRPALAPLYPCLGADLPERRSDGEAVWYLQPPDDAWQRQPIPPRYVVFPTYRQGATVELAPLGRSDAVALLTGQSFSGDRLGDRSTATLVRLLREAECYTLISGSLQDGVAAVRSLLGA